MYTDCFARKKTIDFFSKQMEKGRKHPFQSSNTRSQNVGHVGVYFAKISGIFYRHYDFQGRTSLSNQYDIHQMLTYETPFSLQYWTIAAISSRVSIFFAWRYLAWNKIAICTLPVAYKSNYRKQSFIKASAHLGEAIISLNTLRMTLPKKSEKNESPTLIEALIQCDITWTVHWFVYQQPCHLF